VESNVNASNVDAVIDAKKPNKWPIRISFASEPGPDQRLQSCSPMRFTTRSRHGCSHASADVSVQCRAESMEQIRHTGAGFIDSMKQCSVHAGQIAVAYRAAWFTRRHLPGRLRVPDHQA
jgi:hypothetical protein